MEAAELIREHARSLGIRHMGFAAAGPIPQESHRRYLDWIARGCHGSMTYLDRYHDVRANPALLLEGARSIICCAFPYTPPVAQDHDAPRIASYALGEDYHDVIRRKLKPLATFIRENFGAKSRVITDTAPLRERLMARRAGLGFIGLNGLLIVPGIGSRVFLGEIVTTLPLPPDPPSNESCIGCGACLKACPGNALSFREGRVELDARRCLSYLTIEHPGELPPDADLGTRLYGCDTCQDVCPHNVHAPSTPFPEFTPDERLLHISREDIAALTPEGYNALFGKSAIRRAPLPRLLRNLSHLSK